MSPQQRKQLYDVMTPKAVEAGTELMRQGDDGATYFVIESGEADVYVHGPDEVSHSARRSIRIQRLSAAVASRAAWARSWRRAVPASPSVRAHPAPSCLLGG